MSNQITDDKYLIPGTIEPGVENVTVVSSPPDECYLMLQQIILERPFIEDLIVQTNPQVMIHVVGWLVGLMHDQTPPLYAAVMDAIKVGKDVAVVLREQVERERGRPLMQDALTVIYPSSLVLSQFAINETPSNLEQ